MRRHTIISNGVVGALAVGVVATAAACGGSSSSSSSSAASAGSSSGGSAGGAVKGSITFWIQSADPFIAAHKKVVAEFEAANPDAKVNLVPLPFADFQTRLTATMPNGKGPDILEGYAPWMTGYMRNLQLSPVPASIGSSSTIASRYYTSSLGQLQYKSTYYGLPANVAAGSTRVLLANDDVVAKAGVTLPGANATFADWVTAWKALTKSGSSGTTVEGLGQSCGQPADQFISYLTEYGGSLLSSDGKKSAFDSEAGTKALTLIGDLSRTEKVDSPKITDANCIPQGVAATGYRGTWVSPGYHADFPSFKGSYHLMPLPTGATKDVWQGGSGWAVFVPQAGKHKDLAWAFAKFLDEHRQEWIDVTGEIPAQKTLAASEAKAKPELYGAYFPILDQSQNAYVAGDYFVIYQTLSDMATSVTLGKATVSEALATAQKAIDGHLQQWWQQYPGR